MSKKQADKPTIRVPAVQVSQTKKSTIYTFAIDGKVVRDFATISRIKREDGELGGYQRPEVLSHIAEIRQYLESERPMVPNAIVIAFDDRVRFEPEPVRKGEPAYLRRGTLMIPADPETPDEEKPGFVVDGQQRLAAIRDSSLDHFPIAISAFVTNDRAEQTEQFILVNSTKPLQKGLIYELLPSTRASLPSALERRRMPATILERLNLDEDSPLKGKIQTITSPFGTIKDNSILKMLEHSLTDGVLYRFRDGPDMDAMLAVLKPYWAAVARVFPEAWELPARKSRLVHGAGIVSLGFVMDAICDARGQDATPTTEEFEEDLRPLAPFCAWTDGEWDLGRAFGKRKWNEVQNVPREIELLANYLLTKHRELVRDKPRKAAKAKA
jgi:DGQHR domain-containing protein